MTCKTSLKSAKKATDPGDQLYPYQLFCWGSYFGDVELLSGSTRRATARCESPEGTLLSVGKADFKYMCDEFPHMGGLWLRRAHFNERTRLRRNRLLTRGLDYEDYAASRIASFCRQAMQRKGRSTCMFPQSAMLVESSRTAVTRGIKKQMTGIHPDASTGALHQKVEELTEKVNSLDSKMNRVIALLESGSCSV